MIKLKDFLKIANGRVLIKEVGSEIMFINSISFDIHSFSDELLNSEIESVESGVEKIIVKLK